MCAPCLGTGSHGRLKSEAQILGTFRDNSPALTQHDVGSGLATYCAFLPSLSYYKPAIPLRPVDRGATDDAMIHFLPTAFDAAAGGLIASPAENLLLPVECSEALVETTVIESSQGVVIPLVNWSGEPVRDLVTETVSITICCCEVIVFQLPPRLWRVAILSK